MKLVLKLFAVVNGEMEMVLLEIFRLNYSRFVATSAKTYKTPNRSLKFGLLSIAKFL